MARHFGRTGWLPVLIALAIAVFALAPTVEAAVCGPEPMCIGAGAAHGAQADADDRGTPGDSDMGDGRCSHPYCAHGVTLAQPLVAPAHPVRMTSAAPIRPTRTLRTSHVFGGLERPPWA